MNKYILIRTSRIRAYANQMLNTVKAVLKMMCIKVLSDFLWSYMSGTTNLLLAVMVEISTLLSIFEWIILIYLMEYVHIRSKYRYCILVLAIAGAQFISAYCLWFSVFVPGSPAIYETPVFWIAVKMAVVVVMVIVSMIVSRQYECLEEDNIID